MIRIIVSVDEKNVTLGKYFEASEKYLYGLVDNKEWTECYHVINSDECNVTYIKNTLPSLFVDKPYIFVVFTHGSEVACISSGTSYVNKENANLFKGSFFYSTACLTGKKLGFELINNGCSAFVGFTEETNAFCEDEYKYITIKCDLACLYSFLSDGDKTIGQSLDDAISYYNTQIDKLADIGDVLFRGELITNREALTLIGNKDLKRSDLEFPQ